MERYLRFSPQVIEGQVLVVTLLCRFVHHTPNLTEKLEIRDIVDGKKKEERFRTSEKVEYADLESIVLELKSEEDDHFQFTTEDHEPFDIPKSFFGNKSIYLEDEGTEIVVRIYQEKPLTFKFVNPLLPFKVKETREDATRSKPALLENGAKVKVPPYVNVGDTVIIDVNKEEFHSKSQE
eukprot:TRINITY_DN7986_c0_g1_i1.p1 TRINITY_DN7986_c0_g1~~TRINITY_DN7986_c0_g1_i1.p1  ORF type:complete len:180 (+),score=35.96 TRINITY_DN7986_c0_g1_i1:142-681(+)